VFVFRARANTYHFVWENVSFRTCGCLVCNMYHALESQGCYVFRTLIVELLVVHLYLGF